MSIEPLRIGHPVDYERLQVLGEAMRESRVSRRPPVTLVELGSDPAAPRRWSHSHLSKVERGLEFPKEDLVRWYETRTGKPTGYLLKFLYQAIGVPDYVASMESQPCDRRWAIDRLEIFADLTGECARIYETRDLVSLGGDGSHTVVVDSHDLMFSGRGNCVEVIEGGTFARGATLVATSIATLEIELHREFVSGEWHRIRMLHTGVPTKKLPRWLTVATRYGETRELVVIVKFNENGKRPVWSIQENFAAEVVSLFEHGSTVMVEDILGRGRTLTADADGLICARFESLRPGLQYGIGWR